MLMKFSSALLAVVISTMMSTTEALKIQTETGSPTPLEVTTAVFEITDKNDDGILKKKELDKAMKKLEKSDDVPCDKKTLKKVFKKADKADGKDDKVKFDSFLAAMTDALEDEAEEEVEPSVVSDDEVSDAEDEVAEEEDEGAEEEVDSDLRCFIDPVFSDDSILTTNNIQYGSAYNDKTEQQQDLILDAYFPPDSDTRDKRPAVVYMHGGGFTGGDKKWGSELAEELAMRGYAVFSINYRLTGGHGKSKHRGSWFDA